MKHHEGSGALAGQRGHLRGTAVIGAVGAEGGAGKGRETGLASWRGQITKALHAGRVLRAGGSWTKVGVGEGLPGFALGKVPLADRRAPLRQSGSPPALGPSLLLRGRREWGLEEGRR